MDRKNVYVRAREIVRELVPLLERIREHDAKLADQLRRAAQSVELNFRGSTSARKPSLGCSRIIPIGFRDIEHHAIHRALNLIKEGPIPLPQHRHDLPQPLGCLNRLTLNNESHECSPLRL